MSGNDKRKENMEQACFDKAVALAKQRGGQTYEIIKYLDGKPVVREKDDRPDLVRLCTKGKNNPQEVIVGIEHFRVDQLSKAKSDKRKSKGAEYNNRIKKVYEKGHDELERTEDVSEQTLKELMDQLSGLAQENTRKTYDALVKDFVYNLNNHQNNVDNYRKNLEEIAKEKPVEIAFLIEMHTYFPPLYLNKENKVVCSPPDKLIIFKDLVDELEKIDNKKVDYIIILFIGSSFEKATDVLAFRTGNIKNHLKRQNVEIYKYAGGDSIGKSTFDKAVVWWKKNQQGNYNLITRYGNDNENKAMNAIHYALRIAYYSKKQRVPFVASREVQCLLEASWPHIDGFKEQDGHFEPRFKPGTNLKSISIQYEKIVEKYKRMSNDDETGTTD